MKILLNCETVHDLYLSISPVLRADLSKELIMRYLKFMDKVRDAEKAFGETDVYFSVPCRNADFYEAENIEFITHGSIVTEKDAGFEHIHNQITQTNNFINLENMYIKMYSEKVIFAGYIKHSAIELRSYDFNLKDILKVLKC